MSWFFRTASSAAMAKKTADLSLPPPADLERTCRGLAALDAILCDDWEMRYYSFNAGWNKKGKERMASMRNGEGDSWFLVFAPGGAFVKAFWHEHKREDGKKIYAGLPKALAAQLKEAAFEMDDFRRRCLLEGLDEIGLTLRHDDDIARYEASRDVWLPTA